MTTDEAVRAVHASAGIIPLRGRALLEVAGGDRVRFLQGQLTNDVAMLDAAGPRACCYALALTREGRIVAEFQVVARADAIWLETDAQSAAAAIARLEKYVIADDVAIADRSDAFARIAVEGPRASEIVAAAAATELDPGNEAVSAVRIAGVEVVAVCWAFGADPAVQLFVPRDAEADVLAALRAAGAERGAVVADEDVLEVIRIEAGRPRAGAELGPDTLPAELGLVERAVSFTKGCYTGQEVVARMHSRGRVGHLLVGIALEGDGPSLEVPAPITVADARVGEATSVARSPVAGAIALGIVRKGNEAAGTEVRVAGRRGRIVALPFAPATEPR